MKNILKQAWFWIIVVALIAAGAILFLASPQEEVALTVNGEDFSQAEFDQIVDQIANQYKMYGMEVEKSNIKDQAVDQAVQQILLMELAENKGIEVTDEETDEKKQELMGMYGVESEEEFLELLKNQGINNKKQMEDLLAREIRINKLMSLYSDDVEITEEDLQSAYEDLKQKTDEMNEQSEGEPQEIPSFEEVKEDLRSNLVQQKVTPLILDDVDALKEEAEIEEHVKAEDIDVETADESEAPNNGEVITEEETEEETENTTEEENEEETEEETENTTEEEN